MDKIYNCKECGCEFTPKKRKVGTYCSRQCSSSSHARELRLARPNITCGSCGKLFHASPSAKRKYCSPRCGNALRRAGPPITCIRCGVVIRDQAGHYAKPCKNRKYCGHACANSGGRNAHVAIPDARLSLKAAIHAAYAAQKRLDVVEDRKAGMTTGALADKHGCSKSTIVGWVVGYPLPIPRPALNLIDIELAAAILSWPRSPALVEAISCLN